MNKLVKRILFGFLICMCIAFTGCSAKAPTIVGISMAADTPTEILINQFNYKDYSVVISYSNKKTRTIPLTEEMMNPNDYLDALKKEGHHDITITIQGYSCIFSFDVKKMEFTDVYMNDQTVVYDGEFHSLTVEGNLPDGTRIEFADKNSYKNANEYEVTARISNDVYVTKVLTAKLTILKADYDLDSIKFEDATFGYDGSEKSIEVTGINSGVKVSYKIGTESTNKKTDAGVYTVTAHFESSANYNNIPDMDATLTIEKATYDMSPYTLTDKTVYYTGERTDIHITNEQSLPEGVRVTYIGLDDAINAGEYTIIARFTGSENYNDIEDVSCKLTIKPAVVGLSGVYLDSLSVVYDGKEHGIEYSGSKPNSIVSKGYTIYNQDGEKVYDSSSTNAIYKHKPVDVGTYVVYAHFAYKDNKNYADIEPLSAILIITKADITDIQIENEIKEYIPGMGQSLTVRTGMAGITATPSIASPINPGDYVITYTFTLSDELAKNYNVPEPITRTLSITRKSIFDGESTQKKYYATYDGEVHKININLSADESKWIKPYFFYYNEFQQEEEFIGATEPGTYLVFATFSVDEDKAPENYQDYYSIPSRSSAYLIINKKQIEFDETWLENRMTIYDGTTKSISLDLTTGLQGFLAANKGLSDGDFTITYNDNYATDSGYYKGTLNVEINGNKSKYYENLYNYEFHYAIRNTSGKEKIYPYVLQKTFKYDGEAHSLVLSNIPEGITVSYGGDANSLIKPGNSVIYIFFHFDNDVAEFYYEFPELEISTMTKDPQMLVTLTVLHIDYVPELEIPTYVFELGNESKEIREKKPISGVNIDFDYDDEVRLEVGTYGVTVNVVITNSELLEIYNPTYSFRAEFSIIAADYKFSFVGLNAIYDGELHNVSVAGIEEELKLGYISYKVYDESMVETKGFTEVGIYKVYIKFENNSANYNKIPDQSLQLSIETSKVKTQDLVDYVNKTTYARVNQTDSVYSFLSTIIDTKPYDIVYKADYYLSDGTPQYVDDPLFHHQGTTDDFEFTQFTSENGFVLFEFTLTFKKGYEAKDKGFTTTYHGFIRIKVMPVNEFDISSTMNKLRNTNIVSQGKTFNEIFLNGFSGVNYSYTLEYLNGDTPYDDRYLYRSGSSEDKIPFTFMYNTYGERKVKVVFNVYETGDYLFYDGIHSVKSLSETFYLNVAITDTIDAYEFIDKLTAIKDLDQYTKLDQLITPIYDDSLYELTYIISNENGEQVSDNTKNGLVIVGGILDVKYTLTAKYDYVFLNNHENEYTFTLPLIINETDSIHIQSFLETFNNLNTDLRQYDSLYAEVRWKLDIPDGLKVDFEVVEMSGGAVVESYTGCLSDLYKNREEHINNDATNYTYVFDVCDPTTPDGNKVYLKIKIYPAEKSYVLFDGDKILGNELFLEKTFTLSPSTLVEYYYLHYYSEQAIKYTHNLQVDQYTKLYDYISYAYEQYYKKYVQQGLITLELKVEYLDKDRNSTLICDDWDKLSTTLVPAFDNWTEDDKIKISFRMEAVGDVIISRNPGIGDRTKRPIGGWELSVNKINVDKGLTDKMEDLTAESSNIEIPTYTSISSYINDNILSSCSGKGITVDSYTLQSVDKTTKNVDKSFIKVTKTLADTYYLTQASATNKIFKLTITFKFDNNNETYILSKDGLYVANPTYDIYFTSITNENAFDISSVNSYKVDEYTQFNVVEDTINKISISDKIKIESWSLSYVKKSDKSVVLDTYNSKPGSTTKILRNYARLNDAEKDGILTITYKAIKDDTLLISNNEILDVNVFTASYTFVTNYYGEVSYDNGFSWFADNGWSYGVYALVGYSPNDYSNYFTSSKFIYTNSDKVHYKYDGTPTYETTSASLALPENSPLPSDAVTLKMKVIVYCEEGYYFKVVDGKPVTELVYEINKPVKTPLNLDTSYLTSLSGHGPTTKDYTFSFSAGSGVYPFDSVNGVTITYTVDDKREYTRLTDITIPRPTDITFRIPVEWVVSFNGKSTEAIHFTNPDNTSPIGYQNNFKYSPYNSWFSVGFE